MRILLTNDDGHWSEGIAALREALTQKGHTVWTVAPTRNMSACSQSITTTRPLRLRPLSDERCFSCNGTPADCVILGLSGVLDTAFDCVVSGINIGPNLGDDITFSGTVGAARQSVLMGKPAIAVSLFNELRPRPHFFTVAATHVATHLPRLVSLSDSNHLVNINIPNNDNDMQWVFAHPAARLYDDFFSTHAPPHSADRFYFVSSAPKKITPEQHSDLAAVRNGQIAVSVINIHPYAKHMGDGGDPLSNSHEAQ